MSRAPGAEDLRLWAIVAATVRPLRPPPPPPPSEATQRAAQPPPPARTAAPAGGKARRPPLAAPPPPPAQIEPGRLRRLAIGREGVAARVDLHGLDQDAARAALTRFVQRAAADGWRAVLVITGKGAGGDGVLRRRAPEWLAAPPLRAHVAGISPAHRRHGGEGALYVALKRPL